MEYSKTITLKDGRTCILRNGTEKDGKAVLDNFILSHEQMELNVVAENTRAIIMYEAAGFVEFGRNPRGFKSRLSGYQELVYMRLE